MTITLKLNPEIEACVKHNAKAMGLSPEQYLHRLIQQAALPMTGAELAAYWEKEGVIGAWKDRDDIEDSVEFARNLRRQAENRLSD